jgi:hypothetical protein
MHTYLVPNDVDARGMPMLKGVRGECVLLITHFVIYIADHQLEFSGSKREYSFT